MTVSVPDDKSCVECGKPSIATCPYCKKPVHHGYGLDTHNCSAMHDQKCSGAAWSRDRSKKS